MKVFLNDNEIKISDISASIVVAVSGGKDSQACLKKACKKYDNKKVIGVFLNTKWEHPATYKHIKYMSKLYNVDIYEIRTSSVEELVVKFNRFPNSLSRFCTTRLKIRPSKFFYKELSQKNTFEVWLGMRTDESYKRNKKYGSLNSKELYQPYLINKEFPKYLSENVSFRLPIINWTTKKVFEFLNGKENILYSQGAKRVGCFPCLASSAKSHQNDFNFDGVGKIRKQKVIELENKIGIKHKQGNTSQICMFCNI